jgi:hypothetical protein
LPPSNPLLPWTHRARHPAGHPAWHDGGAVGRVGCEGGGLRSTAGQGAVGAMREGGSPRSAVTRMRDEPYSYLLALESRVLCPVLRSLCLSYRPCRPLVGRDVWPLAFVPYVVLPASFGWVGMAGYSVIRVRVMCCASTRVCCACLSASGRAGLRIFTDTSPSFLVRALSALRARAHWRLRSGAKRSIVRCGR